MPAKKLLSSTFKWAVQKLCSLAYLFLVLQLVWLHADQHLGFRCIMCSFLIIAVYFIAFCSSVFVAENFSSPKKSH